LHVLGRQIGFVPATKIFLGGPGYSHGRPQGGKTGIPLPGNWD